MANAISNRYSKAEPIAAVLAGRCQRDSGYRGTISLAFDDDFWLEAAVAAGVSHGRDDYVPSGETAAYALFLLDEKLANTADPFRGLS